MIKSLGIQLIFFKSMFLDQSLCFQEGPIPSGNGLSFFVGLFKFCKSNMNVGGEDLGENIKSTF